MLIKLPSSSRCSESDVTPEGVYLSRRRLMQGVMVGTASGLLPDIGWARYSDVEPAIAPPWLQRRLGDVKWSSSEEKVASFEVAIQYNNFYEFGPRKTDPARYAPAMTTEPWSVRVDGLVARPGVYDLDKLCAQSRLQERIYRLRCVEAWSMVIPWLGFPLAELIRRVEPLAGARYVRFETLHRPEEMPGARSRFSLIDWPYVEGLRLDEAMHPLTLLAVGMYGRVLANQNGAPLRLVVPWKYGFKSIKSIVRISFVSDQSQSSWVRISPGEYGFYANVNPAVSHPRWSQAQERRLPNTLFSPNVVSTELFNGYGDDVAELYRGMDLRKNY